GGTIAMPACGFGVRHAEFRREVGSRYTRYKFAPARYADDTGWPQNALGIGHGTVQKTWKATWSDNEPERGRAGKASGGSERGGGGREGGGGGRWKRWRASAHGLRSRRSITATTTGRSSKTGSTTRRCCAPPSACATTSCSRRGNPRAAFIPTIIRPTATRSS